MKKLLQSLFILVLCAFSAFAQERTVTGTVTAQEDGLPIPGVSVKVKEVSNLGTQTSGDGKFSLKVPSNGKTLIFSYLGYATKEVAITSGNVSVSLVSDTKSLNEVVVTAGGLSATKAQLGTASTTIKAELLTQAKPTNVAAALSGKVAGLQLNVVGSGVNPSYRLVLRGNRSLLGNNTALVVVDNVIVPSSILGNLNPDDIEDLQVLNGGGAAALYGSEASNGALVITTKKGKRGSTNYKIGQTTNAEWVSFYPKLQKRFGSGTEPDVQTYNPHENQQYGPAFDGVVRPIGDALENGAIQMVPYAYNDSKYKFWDTGVTNMTDFSMSTGDDKSLTFLSAQYLDATGTTPKDAYNRFTLRLNGDRDFGKGVSMSFNANYVQNRSNVTTATSSMYDQLMQTPSNIPVTDYKDWRNNPFANPDGYYNAYYQNPYYTLDNQRQAVRNDYLTGNIDLRYKPLDWLRFTYRVNITSQNASNKNWVDKFVRSAYTKGLGLSSLKNNDIAGSVSDGESFSNQLLTEFQANINKKITKDLKLDLTLGASLRNNTAKSIGVAASGLTFQGLFNIAARTAANITGNESNSTVHQQAIYGDMRLSFKDYLYLHATARNDWFSTLPTANRSLFYPSVDASFIATNAIDALKDNKFLNVLKLRASYTTVGNVNLGAYQLLTTFSQTGGYPYNNNPGYAIGNQAVNPNLKPERTKGFEGGVDAEFWDNRISLSSTLYYTSTTDQIVPVNISSASGFSTYLTNTGDVTNFGSENSLNVIAYRNTDWEFAVGGTFTYYENKVKSISDKVSRLNLSTGGNAQVVAEAGQTYPMLRGTDFKRDALGRVIVDINTGYPSATESGVLLGNTSPKYIMGLNLSVKYKTLRLAAVAEYRGGYVIQSPDAGTSFEFSGSGERTVTYNRERFVFPNSSYLDPVTNQYVANNNITVRDGGAGFWPSSAYNTGIASNYVYSGAYWKIREISLSWDLPKKWLGNMKVVKGINIAAQGRNLFLFVPKENLYTDPDYILGNNAIGITTLAQTPPTRFFGGSVSVTF
ncbi:SusC/RagA family TonB-linked outer membrane protein [Pedobacter nototheniae]|uniref:SusC/RagA family TonB-linked outer membrane protein n=1 Tax=Pedobacter nototheniae TaxID=2488994 RepID=UPI0013F47CF7|nr:SusC/RagA family TonB-linked outer membrane protein [Pedobacter nototheniae]